MNWTCPHCGSMQIPTSENTDFLQMKAGVGKFQEAPRSVRFPSVLYKISTIKCANVDCQKITSFLEICCNNNEFSGIFEAPDSQFFSAQIYPRPLGRPFPLGVPEKFLCDYREAWSIIDLSPKSSATLARRCLQGMIRDFCNIKERTLFDEINKLEKMIIDGNSPRGVDQDSVEAMKAVKNIGNIGAHMTELNGTIVDVDQDEARILLGLIEMLFTDWYVARAKREKMLQGIVALGDSKRS